MHKGIFGGLILALALVRGPAGAEEKNCMAENGVKYSVAHLFAPQHACYALYVSAGTCPLAESVCANLALFKLGNYQSTTYQDLMFTPHRGTWGSTFGSDDPNFTVPPAQNTIDAVNLATSFTTKKYHVNKEGKDYKPILRGRGQELDITTYGSPYPDDTSQVIMNHYLTVDDTITGTLYQYLMDMRDPEFQTFNGQIERRDFSMSPTFLNTMTLENVAKSSIIDADDNRFGVIAFLDIKATRGKIPCQTENLKAGNPGYAENECKYNVAPDSTYVDLQTQLLAALNIYDAGGEANVVIKTSAKFDEVKAKFGSLLYTFMWQPHIGQSMGPEKAVQYIHDWLVNAPRAVLAWEMNIYAPGDQTTDTPFCVTDYLPPGQAPAEYPYGQVKVAVNPTSEDGCMAEAGGLLVNLLDYLRVNTGNPDYFGFSDSMKAKQLYSGNRANLWLMETVAPAGTADRYYRWQMLGSDSTYSLADPVRTLNYPYAAYAILTGDRMESLRQILEKGLYAKWGPDGRVEK